ncbi:MAG: DUF971 domain-containing protein [Gammaproteobacteria bacterium]|nr:DUF971 domain-containing protein [Gammaproteobacteria bacterium]
MKEHNPIEVNLHKKSRLLEISFDTGENYKLSCEYLRTHGKSAEITTSDVPVAGKINVNIDSIEAQGSYARNLLNYLRYWSMAMKLHLFLKRNK